MKKSSTLKPYLHDFFMSTSSLLSQRKDPIFDHFIQNAKKTSRGLMAFFHSASVSLMLNIMDCRLETVAKEKGFGTIM